jgi:cardiolipin synthase A/B
MVHLPDQKKRHAKPIRKVDGTGYYVQNRIKLVKGGREYFDLLECLINEAKSSIHLQTYIFDSDTTGRRIARALLNAAARNVKVAILIDGYASQSLPFWLIESFRAAGIQFNWFHPFWKSKRFYFGRRLHHKVVVIDTRKVLVGGLNISDRYNDTDIRPAWLDWAIYAEGDVAAAVQRVCQRRSKISLNSRSVPVGEYIVPDEKDPRPCKVRVRINDWVNRKMQITNSYLDMFRKAKSHIIIASPYFMPGNKFRKKILEAVKRGVRISIILGSKSDIAIARYAEQYLYPWLLRNKIEIYEYQKNVLHGKMATYDGTWVTNGSYNINNISAYASVELNLDVHNRVFAQRVEGDLKRIMLAECEQVTLDNYRKRSSLYQRFLQRSAYDIIRLLFFLFTFYFRQRD